MDLYQIHCDVGTKKNSKGYKESWIGYKVHADVTDCLLAHQPGAAASLHDSQVAIPLMKMSQRVDYLYDLIDAAYDAKPIYEVSRSLGHVPIIDKNGRGKGLSPWPLMRQRDTGKGPSRSGSTAGLL